MAVDQLRTDVAPELEAPGGRRDGGEPVREESDRRFEMIEKRLDTIDERISREAESTRRHSGILTEQIKSYIKALARRQRTY